MKRNEILKLFFYFLNFVGFSKSNEYVEEKFSPYVALDIGNNGMLQLFKRAKEDCPFYKSLEKDPRYYYFKDKWFIRYK